MAQWKRSLWKLTQAMAACALIGSVDSSQGAETLLQEGFNTDGNGSRYTVTGAGAYEPNEITWQGDQAGPIYWARSSEVSFVGVPGATPARRALWTHHANVDPELLTTNFWTMFDATVAWLTKNKTSGIVLFSADPSLSTGDTALADRLTAKGFTVQFDEAGAALPAANTVALVVKTSAGNAGVPGRFSAYAAPMLQYNAADFDDELIGSIGTSAQVFTMSNLTITSNHPAAGGLTGSVPVFTGEATFDTIGDVLPERATVVATYTREIPFVLNSIEQVEGFVDGSIASTKTTATVPSLDISDASSGAFFDDNLTPDGTPDSYAIVAKGKIQVTTAGNYRFAFGADDGGRLRIDKDKNGFTAADNVVVMNATGAHRFSMANVNLAVGTYDFEAVHFDQGGGSSLEVAVSTDTAAGDPLLDASAWELLSTAATGAVKLNGDANLDIYVPNVAAASETRPYLALLEEGSAGGLVLSGGPFVGFEGTAYFAGAGMNKGDADQTEFVMPAEGYRYITFNPINVRGKQNVRISLAAAGTFLDFETSDFLDVWIDPDGTGPQDFTQLIHFTAPTGSTKFLDDRSTHPNNPVKLGLRFQDVTYDVPAGATDMVIQIRAFSSWWNEILAFDNLRVTAGALDAPTIAIAHNGTTAVVTFSGVLQRRNSLTSGDWADVAGSSPLTVDLTADRGFFRARQ